MPAIRLLLSHSSALEVIRSWDMRAHFERPEIYRGPVPGQRVTGTELEILEIGARRVDVRGKQIDLLVADREARLRSEPFRSHVCSDPLPIGAIYRLPHGIGCVSPEHVIVQLATELNRLELQVLMYELLGIYALCPEADGGMFQRCEPIMTLTSLEAHLDALGNGFRGVAKVRAALPGVVEGSGSPRETQVALRCCLKRGQGGYGIPIQSMNNELPVPRLGKAGIVGVRKPDIVIAAAEGAAAPFSFVAVEYDGAGHLTPEQQAVDAQRTNEILALNGKEYRINKEIYSDMDQMDDVFGFIRHDIGLKQKHLTAGERRTARERRVKLKKDLDFIMSASPIIPSAAERSPNSDLSRDGTGDLWDCA